MSERVKLESDSNLYFQARKGLEFISSGCKVLDCTIGGGWPLRRTANIVGDESTGKTLLAIEAMANFYRLYPQGKMFFRESEWAFDEDYARSVGMPVDEIEFAEPGKLLTVENFYDDLLKCAGKCQKKGVPGIYFLDSMDGLSDEVEIKADFGAGTYGITKAKQMHKLMRLCTAKVSEANMFLGIISQTKDKINSQFPAKTRSSGHALDFWCSQILWLSHDSLKDEVRTKDKIKRVVAISIRAKCNKNKISIPKRQCQFMIRFGHGIDNISSSLDWLEKVFRIDYVIDCTRQTYENRLAKMSDEEYWTENKRIDEEVVKHWHEVEQKFLEGTRRKYV